MSAASNYLENAILNNVLGQAAMPAIANTYIALFTAGPDDSGGGTEVSGAGYARVNLANNTTNWPTTTTGSKANGAVITFPTAGGSWGTVTHFGIFSAATGGNLLFHGSLGSAKVVGSGDAPSFPIGSLVITAD
jgi:hypothetical protein